MIHHRSFKIAALIVVLLLLLAVAIRQLFAEDPVQRQSFVPIETTQVLNNPFMGFVADARYDTATQPVRLAHVNLTWADLEPLKGQYAFTEIERKFNFERWRAQGVRLVVRIILDYPRDTAHKDIPDWLYEETRKRGTAYNTEYGRGFSPDYTNPVLIQYHRELIKQVAARYNDDPLIAFVQIGSVGHWGEWHTYDGDVVAKHIPFPTHNVTDQYVQPYVDYFTDKPLLMRRPHEIALRNGMGLFNDSFGREDATMEEGMLGWYTKGYTNWLTDEEEPAMPDFWTKAPSGGEFAGTSGLLSDGSIEEAIREAKATHVSWLGPFAPTTEPAGGAMQRNIDRFLTTIGYRFVIAEESHEEEAQPGGKLKVELSVNNRGVAPFYFDWPLELSLADDNGSIRTSVKTSADIRTWLPGVSQVSSELPVPNNLPPGEYTVTAAILDPDTGVPGVDFAIEGRRTDGRFSLGTVTITGE
ncbi:DUF4832 domain-containing protein [Paenibacillus aurantiacus]|uniref:DUF4832 domain-containing protein n=1 Tax=Paenibacillus aurantiacus TaxID=1936118 RepID=A0ABV5KKY4_9BACL